jgi:hypothetical protein
MGIHSKILVHWTGGNDIEKRPKDERPQLYVERLKNDLIEGLYVNTTEEDAIRKLKIKNLTRICFSEIRLSQAKKHAKRYGKLGLGFSRNFVLSKGGRPVIYTPFKEVAGINLLEDSFRNVYHQSKGQNHIQKPLVSIMTHIKRMSNGKGEDYYEEMEWRIVHHAKNKHIVDTGSGIHRLKFKPINLKVIIFPNEYTKRLSLRDDYIKKYLSKHMPIIASLQDCRNF